MTEPYYDEDLVNLAFLKKQLEKTDETIENATKNISRHYGSQPIPPYNVGDTWSDGSTIYVCIHSRLVGNYVGNDWTTESGALETASYKSKTYLQQPTNYQLGDTWLLQSDTDHPEGKKGEILVANKNGKEYIEDDWVKKITYVTHAEKVEIDEKIESATNRIADIETTAGQISLKVQETEAKVNDTYSKAEIEAMNNELLDDLDIVSKKVAEIELESDEISMRVESSEKGIEEVKTDAVKTVQVMYALSDSETVKPEDDWSTTAPKWEQGKYMWQKTVTTYADGNTVESNATCISGAKGEAGIGVKELETQYYLSSSNTEQIDGEWSTDEPEIISGYYLWTRIKTTWTDETITYTTPIASTSLNIIVEKIAEQEITDGSIKSTVEEIKTTMENDYATKEEAKTEYTQLKASFEFDITKAIEDLNNNGISKVVTTQVTIDDDGVTVGKSDSEFTNTMNNTGTYQYNAGELIAKYDKDGAEIPRLKSDFAIIAGLKYVREEVGGIVHHKTYVLE